MIERDRCLGRDSQITVVTIWEWTKSILCSKWGHFDRVKPILKILLVSWTFYIVEKGFKSLNAENLGSVGQRTAKLLTIKLCACALFGLYGRKMSKRFSPDSSCTGVKSFSKFDGQSFCSPLTYRPQITCMERSIPSQCRYLCQNFKRLAAS